MEVLLDGGQLKTLAGDNSIILSYPELYKYDSIESLFSNGIKKVVILYLQEKNGNNMRGHWCLLTKHKNKVSFFDPYSLMPDSQLKWNTKEEKEELDQDERHLTKLLLDFAEKGGNVEYNEVRFQKKHPMINTCGRHVGVRARFYDIPLTKYQRLFKVTKKNTGMTYDEIIVNLSDYLLNE